MQFDLPPEPCHTIQLQAPASRWGFFCSQHLRQIGADEVAALVQVRGIPVRTIAPKVGHPLAHIAAQAVLSNELGHAVTALARASCAFNPQHFELASDITKGEIRSGHSGLWFRQFAFSNDARIRFVQILDAIFELAPVLWEPLSHLVGSTRHIPTD